MRVPFSADVGELRDDTHQMEQLGTAKTQSERSLKENTVSAPAGSERKFENLHFGFRC